MDELDGNIVNDRIATAFSVYTGLQGVAVLVVLPLLVLVLDMCCWGRQRGGGGRHADSTSAGQLVRWSMRWLIVVATAVSSFSVMQSWCVALVQTAHGVARDTAVLSVLEVDMAGIKNLMHAGLLFGTLSLFAQDRNARYFLLLLWGFLLMTVAVFAVAGEQVAVLVGMASAVTVGDKLYMAISVVLLLLLGIMLALFPLFYKAVGFDTKPANDVIAAQQQPHIQPQTRQRTWLMAALVAEAVVFGLQRLLLAIDNFNGSSGDDSRKNPAQFMAQIIGAYGFALHRAFIIGTGFSGAVRGDLRYIKIFIYGNSIFAVFHTCELIVGLALAHAPAANIFLDTVNIVSLTASIIAAVVLHRYLVELRGELAREPWFALPSNWSQSDSERPSLWNAVWDKSLSRSSRESFLFASFCLWSVLVLWIVEALWLVLVNIPSSDEPSVASLKNFVGSVGDALNYGLHGVAMHIFAYYRSVQDPVVFTRRKLFHVVTQSSFALYSALQLFNLLALDASTYTSMELFLAVRLVMYITSAVALWRLKIERLGFGVDLLKVKTSNRVTDEEEIELLQTEETQGLLSGDADVETEEERSVTNRIQLYAKLQTLAGYFFFIAIAAFVLVLIVVEQLAHAESSSMSMDDMTASHSHSVAYGVAFHYLFITAGYGIRAGQDASVLFLDVFRNAMYVVVPVTLVAFVACIATGASSSSVISALATSAISLLLFASLGSARTAWSFNRLILAKGYRTQDSHM